MNYFVVTDDGQRYGPVDLAGLQRWVQEGRVLPNTTIQTDPGGDRVAASAIQGLVFNTPGYSQTMPGPAPGAGPTYTPPNQGFQTPQTNYYRGQPGYAPYPGGTDPDIQKAYIYTALGLVCCFPLSFVGLTFALKAKQRGNPKAQGAVIFAAIVIAVDIVLLIVRVGMLVSR